ncbi:MAG: hypothetical protein V3R25_09520 [Nitrosomonadaceae bacterium]
MLVLSLATRSTAARRASGVSKPTPMRRLNAENTLPESTNLMVIIEFRQATRHAGR